MNTSQFYKPAVNVTVVYLVCIITHYSCVHAYQYSCTPTTFHGFIMSPLMASAPHCKGLRFVIYEMGQKIDLMWFAFGAYCVMFMANRLSPNKN
jgi:hypothetical protein